MFEIHDTCFDRIDLKAETLRAILLAPQCKSKAALHAGVHQRCLSCGRFDRLADELAAFDVQHEKRLKSVDLAFLPSEPAGMFSELFCAVNCFAAIGAQPKTLNQTRDDVWVGSLVFTLISA